MPRTLRDELSWSEQTLADGSGCYVLGDALTGRRFGFSSAQHALISAAATTNDTSVISREVAGRTGEQVSAEEVGEILKWLEGLAIFDEGLTEEQVRTKQMDGMAADLWESQKPALEGLVRRLREQTAFYRERLPASFEATDRGCLEILPVTQKEDLRHRFHEMIIHDAPRAPNDEVLWASTSGTTGDRVQVASTRNSWIESHESTWLMNDRIREILSAGDDLRSCILTTPICSGTQCHVGGLAPLEDRIFRGCLTLPTQMSFYDAAPEVFEQILTEIENHGPTFLEGAPNYIAALAHYILRTGRRVPRLDLIVTCYELGGEVSREVIRRVFECPLYDSYANSELGQMAIECPHGNYHVPGDRYIFEILPDDETRRDDAGLAVITGLVDAIVPLVRYNTRDIVRRVAQPCRCSASETDTFASIEGRLKEVVWLPDGRRLTPRRVDEIVAPVARGVKLYKLVSMAPDRFELQVVPADPTGEVGAKQMEEALRHFLGSEATLSCRILHRIPSESTGKYTLLQVRA